MTAEERIDSMRVACSTVYCTDCPLFENLNESDDLCKYVHELMQKAERYKWHNSLDFPEPCKNVLCFCRGNQYQVMSHLEDRWYNSWNHQTYMDTFVIAWKEIEPFEEVEE